jgi:hypothetical protein
MNAIKVRMPSQILCSCSYKHNLRIPYLTAAGFQAWETPSSPPTGSADQSVSTGSRYDTVGTLQWRIIFCFIGEIKIQKVATDKHKHWVRGPVTIFVRFTVRYENKLVFKVTLRYVVVCARQNNVPPKFLVYSIALHRTTWYILYAVYTYEMFTNIRI